MYGLRIIFSDGRSEILPKKFRSRGAALSEKERQRTRFSVADVEVIRSLTPTRR